MKKITTLFKKDPNDLSRVLNEVDPNNSWVYDWGIPTRKYDGTACAIIGGSLYKRYDAKHGKTPPEGAIPCQDPDPVSGHWPHWVLCTPHDKHYAEAIVTAVKRNDILTNGTYELVGPKVQSNPENFTEHHLVRHGSDILDDLESFDYESIKVYLTENDIEGIVFHDGSGQGRMCKIRKKDFGLKRNKI